LKISAIVPAAGQSRRMGSKRNKQFLLLGEKPVLAHTLTVLENCREIEEVVVVVARGEEEYCRREVVEKYHLAKVVQIISGGQERQDSVYQGIQSLSSQAEIVVIHDGARPFLTSQMLGDSIQGAKETGGAIMAVPVKDTIKVVSREKIVENTLLRETLWAVQTPQAFSYPLLKEAHESAQRDNFLGTDDASLVERIGGKIKVILGSYENLKITTPEDLVIGKAILERRESGCG